MAYKKRNYSPEEKAAYNAKKQSEMDEMIQRIDEGVKAVFESERYKEYLKFASKFTDYSARNTMLINMQKPDATLVAAYGKWKELGRHISKGETGIAIFAPTPYKTNQYIETQRPVFDELGNQLYNEDGTEKMETIETPLTGMAFKTVYVFDVSQTDGRELPEPVSELTGDVDSARKEAVFAAIRKITGIEVEFQDIKGSSKGYYSPAADKIVIKTGMSDAQTLKTVFHEAAHKLLHDPKSEIVTVKSPRNEKEVQAESVAFMVAEKFGLDTSEYSFPYIASWSEGKQLEQLKNALQEIQSAAKQISNAIESELLKMQKRHLSIDEKIADTELNNVQKAEFLIEDCADRGVEFSEEDTKTILEFSEQHDDISETVQFVEDMEVTQRQRDNYGYDFTFMKPIDSKEAALEAFDKGEAVYLLYPDNTEGMAETREDIENFGGYFGIEKEPKPEKEHGDDLINVSKDVALEMWEKNSDVFIDGVPADSREDIANAPDTAKFAVLEYQFSAELDFDKIGGNTMARNYDNSYGQSAPTNPNVIGNTPYNQLGGKGQLQFYTDLKNRHADNVAKRLDEDGVRFSGMRKGTVTTITINKADIPRYEAAVEKVKQMYDMLNKPAAQVSETVFREQTPKPKQTEQPRTDIPEMSKDEPDNFRSVPICTQSFMEAKQSGNLGAWKDSVAASKACIKFIEANLNTAYEGRDLEGFVKQLNDKFGIDRAMYTVAATVQLKDQDGRFTNAVKNNAAQYSFDSDNMRLKFLTEQHPVKINHLYQQMMKMEHDLRLNAPEQEQKLSANFDGKLLYSSERVKLNDDFRGIPETKYYKSSANEYFIPEIGWLDNDAYEREKNNSDLTGKEFYAKVTRVNANCIDSAGLVGQMDMSRAEYDAMMEKTYSPENAEALKSALGKLDERRNAVNIPEKPTEYYAVRQENNRKFSVCSISADGLVTTVKPNISSITEAKKAMLEIFEQKKNSARIELVHPQTLDELSAKMYKNRAQNELHGARVAPDVMYRINLNSDKKSADTHVLQEYTKNTDDTYSVGQEVAKGDYEKCNKFLSQLLNEPKREAPVQTYEIYQVKNSEDMRYICFMPYEFITKNGGKPDFANYDKVYEGNAAEFDGELGERLEAIYQKFNLDHPEDYKGRSLSVSDVVVLDDKAYYVDRVGFKPLEDFIPLEIKQSRFYDELPKRLSDIAEGKIHPLQDNLLKIGNDALKLNVPPAVMREAVYRLNNEKTDRLAESYEKMYERKHSPDREPPEQDKPAVHKKPKL